VDLGQPIEVPRISVSSSSEHREYLDLVARYDRADVAAVRDIFVEASAGKVVVFFMMRDRLLECFQDEQARFVFFVSMLDVETLDIELLLYHIFKVSPALTYRGYNSRRPLNLALFRLSHRLPSLTHGRSKSSLIGRRSLPLHKFPCNG
jgi:hypothetical protein